MDMRHSELGAARRSGRTMDVCRRSPVPISRGDEILAELFDDLVFPRRSAFTG